MFEFLVFYRGAFQHLAIFGLTLFAFLRGDNPEKWAGSILTAMVLIFYLYIFLFPNAGEHDRVDIGYFAIDAIVFVALAAFAMRANRTYPLWMLGAQLIATMMHFNREISPNMAPMAYFVLIRAPSYIQIMAFALGLIMHRRRIARYGKYRSWRIS